MISSQNRHSERSIPGVRVIYKNRYRRADEFMSVCVSADPHTHTLLDTLSEVVISILFHFNINTHIDLTKIKIVSKNRRGRTFFKRKTLEAL